MAHPDEYIRALWEAERLIQELGISALPVDPLEIAEKLGISVRPMPEISGGASGMLVHIGGHFVIGYPTHINNEGFKRFSICHEIGHFRLPGHVDAIFDADGKHLSRAGFEDDDLYEREADHFAANLLMPAKLFSAELRNHGDGLDAIESLSIKCGTSLESTAIRFTRCSKEPVAMVRSSGKVIDYAIMSDELREFPNIEWIRRGALLAKDTVTYQFNQNRDRINHGDKSEGISLLQDWFGGPYAHEVTEEVIGLGAYGKTLTVLTGIDANDEDDFEHELEESWKPRFKR